MKIEAYKKKYHNDNGEGKFVDKWMEGIKFLPFTSNPSTVFDKKCSLQGVTGEFFRLWEGCGTQPIRTVGGILDEKLNAYLASKGMPKTEIEHFCKIVKDVLFVDGNLNINDSALLKFQPYLPCNTDMVEKEQSKYKSGEIKIANYVYSMKSVSMKYPPASADNNLFINVLREALKGNGIPVSDANLEEYYILPFIKTSFQKDFQWLMKQEAIVKTKYLSLFFYFYACYSVVQSVLSIKRGNKTEVQEKPIPMYFMLASEKASAGHDAVLRGWQYRFPQGTLEHLYGEVQTIDIVNSLLGDKIGLYPELLAKMKEVPFTENKNVCETILDLLQEDKKQMFSHRNSESADGYNEILPRVASYEDFLEKLRYICVGMQSPSYVSRIKKKVTDLLGIRFLQSRRGYRVMVLDNEMLLFLIAMVTKNEKTKLEDMYKLFLSYGICLNRSTRLLIEDYLLKLNLLDRKSDSGEAQYVKVVL